MRPRIVRLSAFVHLLLQLLLLLTPPHALVVSSSSSSTETTSFDVSSSSLFSLSSSSGTSAARRLLRSVQGEPDQISAVSLEEPNSFSASLLDFIQWIRRIFHLKDDDDDDTDDDDAAALGNTTSDFVDVPVVENPPLNINESTDKEIPSTKHSKKHDSDAASPALMTMVQSTAEEALAPLPDGSLRNRLGNFTERVVDYLNSVDDEIVKEKQEEEEEEEERQDENVQEQAFPKASSSSSSPSWKSSLFPLSTRDYIGLACAIFGLVIAAGGGIGGGGLLVPIYALILELPVKRAISFSSATVLGGAVANVVLNSYKRHPHAPKHINRGLVDWDLTLLLVPTQIGGTLLGASLHAFLPELLLIVLLLAFLSLTAYKTITKANQLHEKESIAKNMTAQVEEKRCLLDTNNDSDKAESAAQKNNNNGYDSMETEKSTEDSESLETDETQAISGEPSPINSNMMSNFHNYYSVYWDIGKLTLLFAVVTGLNILKGRGVEQGAGRLYSLYYQGLMLFILLGFVAWVRLGLLYRLGRGGPALSDITWDESNTVRYPAICIVAGLVAGLFGIGGGMVMGPLMLELGVEPNVAAATSAMMILFTAATAAISYFMYGQLPHDYAVAGLVLGFVATLAGQTFMGMLLHKYQRPSLIAYCIGIVVALSAASMTIESIMTLLEG